MRTAALVLAAGLAAAVGCAGALQRPALETTRFVIELPSPAGGTRTAGPLGVDLVRVSPLFDRKGFVYRTGEETFASDARFEFFAPPGAVLREAMIDWLEDASVFASIERGAAGTTDWFLETRVDRLYADRRDPAVTEAVLAGRFRLLDLRGPRPRTALTLRFAEREPAGNGAPQALVDAWGRGWERALLALEADLRAAAAPPLAGPR